jgi:uncharacterized membrane protein HdeD (DUF308 family)
MSETGTPETESREALRKGSFWLIVLGAVLVLGGTAALFLPVAASVSVVLVIGIALLFGGGVQAVHAVGCKGWRARLFHGASAVIYLVGGVLLLAQPLAGLVAVTLLAIAVFFVDGIARIATGISMRPEPGWGWVLTGGLLSVALAVFMFALFPGVSLTLLGVLAGISFLMEGWAFIMVGLAARSSGGTGDQPA